MECQCGYDGVEGWSVVTVYQTPSGDDVDGWVCPECGEVICTQGIDCPPDEFGQTG